MLDPILRLREARQRLRPVAAPITTVHSLKHQIELRRVALRDIGLLRTRLGNLLEKMLRYRAAADPRSRRAWRDKRRFAASRVRTKPGAGQNGRRLVI